MSQIVTDQFGTYEMTPYVPRGACEQLFYSSDRRVLIEGPARCIAGESELWDPVNGVDRRIKDLCEDRIRPWVMTANGPILAEVPFLKGRDRLYRVTLESGRSILATAGHVFASDGLWRRTDSLAPGMVVLSVHISDARRSKRKALGSQCGCLNDPCLCDEPPLYYLTPAQDASPSLNGAPLHAHAYLRTGATADIKANSRPCPERDRLSMPDANNRELVEPWDENRILFLSKKGALCCVGSDNSVHAVSSSLPQYLSPQASSLNWPFEPLCYGLSSTQKVARVALKSPFHYYRVLRDPVKSVKYVRTDDYYDLHVPGEEHYIANGIIHHNTGKSRSVLEKIKACCLRWPKVRALVVRKTRASLTESLLQTWEEFVLPRSMIVGNAGRANREKYPFPNGSEVVAGGMDNPERIMSTEWDLIFFGEALEATMTDVDNLCSRLSNGRMPFQQAIFDCNPGPPEHHLNVAANQGLFVRFKSKHTDNPRLYHADGTITKFGAEYLGDLKRNRGSRYHNLYLGNWHRAEGVVYDEFDPDIHVIDKHDTPFSHFVCGVDWGYVHAGVIQVWGIDFCKRSVLVEEVYRSYQDIDFWRKVAQKIDQKYHPARWICDSARPDYISQFTRMGLPCARAKKDIQMGIQLVKGRLAPQEDGRPAIYFLRDARRREDALLAKRGRPTSTKAEFGSYCYDEDEKIKEIPIKENDDGMDAMRYTQVYLDKYYPLDIVKMSA